MQRRHIARPTLPTQAGLISQRHPGSFSSIMVNVWMTLLFPFSLILLSTATTSSLMSAMRAQSFSSSPAPHMMELAQAGKTLSSNLALLMKRWLANSAQCEGRAFNCRRNQLLRRTDALDRFRSSNSLWLNWGSCAARLEKQVSDRTRVRVYRPIFWHSISQLSSITCPIGVQQVCLQWAEVVNSIILESIRLDCLTVGDIPHQSLLNCRGVLLLLLVCQVGFLVFETRFISLALGGQLLLGSQALCLHSAFLQGVFVFEKG